MSNLFLEIGSPVLLPVFSWSLQCFCRWRSRRRRPYVKRYGPMLKGSIPIKSRRSGMR